MESDGYGVQYFEEELEQEEVTAENWNGGYDEDGNYTGDGEYDEDGNYVGAKPKTALEEAIENWNGGYDEEGDYTGAGEYDESVIMWDRSLHRNLWMRHLMSRETVQEMKVPQMTRVLKLQKMEKVIHHMTTETQMIQMDMVIIQKITVIIRGMILRDMIVYGNFEIREGSVHMIQHIYRNCRKRVKKV